MVEKLLELGANPNAMNKFGMVPLHHAAVAGGSAEVIVALIKAGADVSRFIISLSVLPKTQFPKNAKTQFENAKTQFENPKTQFGSCKTLENR